MKGVLQLQQGCVPATGGMCVSCWRDVHQLQEGCVPAAGGVCGKNEQNAYKACSRPSQCETSSTMTQQSWTHRPAHTGPRAESLVWQWIGAAARPGLARPGPPCGAQHKLEYKAMNFARPWRKSFNGFAHNFAAEEISMSGGGQMNVMCGFIEISWAHCAPVNISESMH
jgi:hypothetical protein